MDVSELLACTVKNNASDLHISSGDPPLILPQLLTETIVLNRLAELKSPPVKQAKGDL